MAILWHELWHEALEEASRQYFGESNVEAMLSTLLPLHQMMEANGPVTLKEIAFVQVSCMVLTWTAYAAEGLALLAMQQLNISFCVVFVTDSFTCIMRSFF